MTVTILPASSAIQPGDRKDVSLPPDKSILHRVLILGSLTTSGFVIKSSTLDFPEDIRSTISILRQLGVTIEISDSVITLHGVGLRGFTGSNSPLDCGNSGTTARLMMGVLAGQSFDSVLIGDSSLSKRPMKRLASLLNDTFGADITCDIGDGLPVRIHGKELYPANSGVTVRSAQIKSALLLASLFTKDRVEIHEDVISRDHTEQMMEAFGLCDGVLSPEHIHYTIPGDFSASAYFIVASIMLESTVTIGNVSLNPTRTRLLDILKECGLQVEITNRKSNWGEDYGDLTVDGSTFAGFDSYDFTEKDVSLCIDELPLVAVLAALSKGKVSIHHAAELRRKESDRITAICTNLCAMGVECEEYEDGFTVTGGVVLRKAVINSFGDHRIAMAFAILGLSSKAEVTIPDADVVSISFPGFFKQLAAVAGEERVQIR